MLPSVTGVILCSEVQPFISIVFITQKIAKMVQFSKSRPSDVSLPVHAGAGVSDFHIYVSARLLPAELPYCFRKGFDLSPYKQVWELSTPVNVRCKVQGRVYLAGDPIEAFEHPHAEFAFGHSLPSSRAVLSSPLKKKKAIDSPTSANSKRKRATPQLLPPFESVMDFSASQSEYLTLRI